MRVLIVGCGYVGLPLGSELLRQGHEVFGVRRSREGAQAVQAAGIEPIVADIAQPIAPGTLPGTFDWVVNCVASGGGNADDYRSTYRDGMRHLLEALDPSRLKKFVYTSSTGVYGQNDGSVVKETSPTEPEAATARVLIESEQVLLGAVQDRKLPGVVLRVAGIYGPGRGHYFRQYLRNEARITGRGERFLNMIHRDDVVGVILAALKSGRAGEIYNVVDDEPVAEIHFYRWLSETLGKWLPPFATEEETVVRKRGSTNKRVQNRRLKVELGYQFRFPTFRQGYTEEIRRLDKAGELVIEPDPR
jgi:nucleoside-diphosphate-sugar epimerase